MTDYAAHTGRLGRLDTPVAIAMWDFSWLLCHYPGGSFADWDEVLEGLTARGYDAVRHGYRFICTSNFTQPQFRGIWDDIAWHRQLTDRIRGGNGIDGIDLCRPAAQPQKDTNK